VPERVLAASSGTMNLLNIGGLDPRSESYFQYIETYAGGQGAMYDADGMDAVQNHMTNTRNAPVESIELAYPLLVETYGLVPDSEGAGHYRGGIGVRRHLRVLGKDVTLTLSSDREKVRPWGLFGGGDASPSKCVISAPDGTEKRLPSKVTTSIPHDHVIRTQTPGGGGWGDPKTRKPQDVLHDVIEEFISPERARSAYGVAVDMNSMTVDEAETARLRG
jgi:N-methylhydantoinase B